jgi:hypothetical protein
MLALAVTQHDRWPGLAIRRRILKEVADGSQDNLARFVENSSFRGTVHVPLHGRIPVGGMM